MQDNEREIREQRFNAAILKETRKLMLRATILKVVENKFGQKVYWAVTPDNAERLLVLEDWAATYEVAIEYVIETLLRHYRDPNPKKRQLFGVPVWAFTHPDSKKILRRAIVKDFPSRKLAIKAQKWPPNKTNHLTDNCTGD